MTFRLAAPKRTGSDRRRAQRRIGSQAESLIESHHALAEHLRLAYVRKRPTPVRVTSVTGGRVSGFFERSPGVDYCGVLAGGRAIYAEGKACHAGTFALREIEPEQWDEMARVQALGALALLLVAWTPSTARSRALLGRTSALCAIPWQVVANARARGDASLPDTVLAEHATGRCYLLGFTTEVRR